MSPSYDALTAAGRSALAASEPLSWLNVTMSPADLSELVGGEVDDHDAAVHNRRSYERLAGLGVFTGDDRPALFVYELATPDHTQTGVVGAVGWDAVDDGLVRGHGTSAPAGRPRWPRACATPASCRARSCSASAPTGRGRRRSTP